MRAKEVDDRAMYNQVTLKFKVPHQKLWLVSRHDALIRSALQRAESQCIKESLCINVAIALGLATVMHNAPTCINNHTQYQALLGRHPICYPHLEGGYFGDLDVRGQNDLARVREIAALAPIEATTEQRLARGDYHKQVVAQEGAEFQQGDLVDIWYCPPNKDAPEWRGPAQIVSVNLSEGNVTLRFQGRTFDRRHQEVRLHVPYLLYPVSPISSFNWQWGVLKEEVDNLTYAFGILGTVFQRGGWHLLPRSSHTDGKRVLSAGLVIAANALHVERAACVPACRGIPTMPAIGRYASCEVLVWLRGNSAKEVWPYAPEAKVWSEFSQRVHWRKMFARLIRHRRLGQRCASCSSLTLRAAIALATGCAADPIVGLGRGSTSIQSSHGSTG